MEIRKPRPTQTFNYSMNETTCVSARLLKVCSCPLTFSLARLKMTRETAELGDHSNGNHQSSFKAGVCHFGETLIFELNTHIKTPFPCSFRIISLMSTFSYYYDVDLFVVGEDMKDEK